MMKPETGGGCPRRDAHNGQLRIEHIECTMVMKLYTKPNKHVDTHDIAANIC